MEEREFPAETGGKVQPGDGETAENANPDATSTAFDGGGEAFADAPAPEAGGLMWELDDTPDDAPGRGGAESFKLRHLGAETDVSREEVIRLAQKGQDYDRIRERAEDLGDQLREAGECMETLREVAKKAGMTLEQFVDTTKAETLARRNGIPTSAALLLTRQERAGRFSASEGQTKLLRQARRREVAEFAAAYGTGFDPASIPGAVWDAVRGGQTLLNAYSAFETRALREKVSELSRRETNLRRSTGSRASDGSAYGHGDIEADWFNG